MIFLLSKIETETHRQRNKVKEEMTKEICLKGRKQRREKEEMRQRQSMRKLLTCTVSIFHNDPPQGSLNVSDL